MSTTTKIAAALLVCGAAAWMLWPESERVPLADAPSIASATDAGLAAPAGGDTQRAAVAALPDGSAAIPGADRSAPKTGPFVRVLDERRFPVAGAHVVLHVPRFGDDATTTDADGIARFVQLSGLENEKRSASVLAWDDRGRAGARACWLKAVDPLATTAKDAETSRALGEVLLGPGSSLGVRVEEDGRPAPNAVVSLEVGAQRVPVLEAMADADGRVRFDHVPAKAVVARAVRGQRAGRAGSILAPGRDASLAVDLQPTRTIDITVLEKKSRAPIAGARLSLSESIMISDDDGEFGGMAGQTFGTSLPLALEVPVTDARGLTRIAGLPNQGDYAVSVEADLHVGPQPPGGFPAIRAGTESLTLELESLHERSARWPLERGEVEAPPSGTELTLRRETLSEYAFERYSPPPTKARIEGGAVVAEGVRDRIYGCYAVAPDGSLARLWIEDGAEVGQATSFRRPRRIDVKVLDTQGLPARGVVVEVRNQGNNLLLPKGTTDERGEVSFDGLWGRRTTVCAEGTDLGVVDLELGDGRVEGRLPTWREVSIRLRLDGEPGLPPTFNVWIRKGVRVVSEDPATGIVRVKYLEAGDRPSVGVRAPGFLGASVEFDAESHEVVDVDLRRGGALLAHVVPPRSGRVRLRCEAWDAEKQRWQTGSAHQVSDERFAPNAPDGAYLFRGLKPGRYRVRDVDAERSSEGVDVAIGAAPAEVALDLSNIVRIRGVIEMPPGFEGWSAHVVIEGEGVAGHESSWLRGSETEEGHYADKDGRFQVSVDTSRPVTLRAAHPYLSPDPKLGSVVVRGDTQDVRLALVAGDEVQIPLAAFGAFPPRDLLRVYAYRGEPQGEPHAWFRASVVGDVARFSGLERGTWTLWMDSRYALAPAVVRGVVVGAGITRVEPEVTPGSSLRVRVLHAPGTTVPHVYVSAHKRTEPTLLRDRNADGEDLVVVTGLGAGSYAVSMSFGERAPVERTIEFDGLTDVDIDFDTREPAPR